MDLEEAVRMGREALVITMQLSLPLLAVGLVVGVLISIIQAATQIQEQTLTFIPKIIAVVATLYVMAPWLITVLVDYTERVILEMIKLH
ncbi:MAG: flagellar biosynthesis protein FliQ [Planctomycetes bacterium]|nr:flagellar biosynthesis protein FliQ [Planctomycetota bacterium]